MSDPAVPARAGAGPPVAQKLSADEPRKLDDVLLAMDVVDTLRHRDSMVDQELNAEAREGQLIARLKEIYGAQGIDVPERILKDGVKALDEQRFLYRPPPPSLGVSLAKVYITRKRWGPVMGVIVIAGVFASGIGWFTVQGGESELRNLPAEITRVSQDDQALAIDPKVDAQIQSIELAGLRAVEQKNGGKAKSQLAALKDMNDQLSSEYDVRIVSRPGEATGTYREANDNPLGKNYYLIVEAVAPGGGLVSVPITSEETQKTEHVSKWAQRVTEQTFDKVRNEKRAGGIQNDILGHKARGELEPKYDVPTPGGALTEW